jgi:hypothetical protein
MAQHSFSMQSFLLFNIQIVLCGEMLNVSLPIHSILPLTYGANAIYEQGIYFQIVPFVLHNIQLHLYYALCEGLNYNVEFKKC